MEIFSRVLAKYLIPRDEIDKLVIQLRSDGYEMFRNLSRKSSPFSSLDLQLPDVEVSSMRVEEGSPMVGKSLIELELRKKHGVTVLAVRRDSQTFHNPEVEMPFFAAVSVLSETPKKLILIPSDAVHSLNNMKVVYIMKDNRTTKRTVQTSGSVKDLLVVENGLAEGDMLIISKIGSENIGSEL